MKRPLVRKRDGSDDYATTPSNPSASAATGILHSSLQPSSLRAIYSDGEQQSGTDTDHDVEDDTEEEENPQLEQYYLTKADSKDTDVGTVYGKGIGVWRSCGGTVNTYIVGETVDGVPVMPQKRKRAQRCTKHNNAALPDQQEYQNTITVLAPNSFALPNRPALLPAPVTALRARDAANVSTIFHHGSAAINPLGAYMRPPVQIRQLPQAAVLVSPSGPAQPPEKRRRVASGSFGTFESPRGRFDERPYRLLPGRDDGKKEESGPGFKAWPWLRK